MPPYAYSYGDFGIRLMEKAGRKLDPWQADGLIGMLGCKENREYAAFEWAEWVPRQNGKGGTLEGRTLTGFLILEEELIMWSAHQHKTSLEAFRRLKNLIKTLAAVRISKWVVEIQDPEISRTEIRIKVIDSHGEEGFERLDNGQRIRFIARSKSSGRGFSGNLNIIDETFAYDLLDQDALMPTLGATYNPQFVLTSSPPLRGDTAEPMYMLRERAERLLKILETKGGKAFMAACAEEALGYRDFGLGGDLDHLEGIDLGNPETWAKANPAAEIRKPLARIGKFYRSMSPRGFAREELGIWPLRTTTGGVIDPRRWSELRDEHSTRDGAAALGVEISPERDYAAIVLFASREDEVGHMAMADYRPGTDWIVGRLAEIRDSLDVVTVAMSRTTFDSLERELESVGFRPPEKADDPGFGDLTVLSGPDTTAACGQLIDAVRQGTFCHQGEDRLTTSVVGSQVRPQGNAVVWEARKTEVDATPVRAATSARYGFVERGALAGSRDVLASIPAVDGQCPSCDAWAEYGPVHHYDDCELHPGGIA